MKPVTNPLRLQTLPGCKSAPVVCRSYAREGSRWGALVPLSAPGGRHRGTDRPRRTTYSHRPVARAGTRGAVARWGQMVRYVAASRMSSVTSSRAVSTASSISWSIVVPGA